MGIDIASFRALIESTPKDGYGGNALMLGRQKVRKNDKTPTLYQSWMDEKKLNIRVEDIYQEDGYAESLFTSLGFDSIETMDFSDYEGAEVIQDLNEPIPKSLYNKYDFIFDGGTLEHVFNVAQSLENVFNLLKPNGQFISMNPLNGWPTHGMFQFSPDLIYAFWRHKAGCEVLRCAAVPKFIRRYKTVEIPDSKDLGGRTNYARHMNLDTQYYLLGHIRKTAKSSLKGVALQGDYLVTWDKKD